MSSSARFDDQLKCTAVAVVAVEKHGQQTGLRICRKHRVLLNIGAKFRVADSASAGLARVTLEPIQRE